MCTWDRKNLWATNSFGPLLIVFGFSGNSGLPRYSAAAGAKDVHLPPTSPELRVMFERLHETEAWMPLLDKLLDECGEDVAQPFIDSYLRGA